MENEFRASLSVDPEEVFNTLEIQRDNGALQNNVTSSLIRYQSSRQYSGLLERIDQDGGITCGIFESGVFIALHK